MYKFPIGVMLESFRRPTDEALDCACRLGVQGIQMYAARGERDVDVFPKEKRRELSRKMEDRGLVFSALCGDTGKGFGNPEANPTLVEKLMRVTDMALELGTNIITTHIGVVPADKAHPRYGVMLDACGRLAEYAHGVGAHFAVETGPERADVLKMFLDDISSDGIGVNLDPANLVMVTGDDPARAVYILRDYIVHTHAKDGIKLVDCDPEYIYGITPMPEELRSMRHFKEVPLGTGSVPFERYLAALDDIGFKGFLTIEREVGEDPYADIETAVNALRKWRDK